MSNVSFNARGRSSRAGLYNFNCVVYKENIIISPKNWASLKRQPNEIDHYYISKSGGHIPCQSSFIIIIIIIIIIRALPPTELFILFIYPIYSMSSLVRMTQQKMLNQKVTRTLQKCRCVGYYRIYIKKHKKIPVPRSRNINDYQLLSPQQ